MICFAATCRYVHISASTMMMKMMMVLKGDFCRAPSFLPSLLSSFFPAPFRVVSHVVLRHVVPCQAHRRLPGRCCGLLGKFCSSRDMHVSVEIRARLAARIAPAYRDRLSRYVVRRRHATRVKGRVGSGWRHTMRRSPTLSLYFSCVVSAPAARAATVPLQPRTIRFLQRRGR